MWAIIPLTLSVLGLLGIFLVKEWEQSSGRILFPGFRKRADARTLDLYAQVQAIPKRTKVMLLYLAHHSIYQSSRTALLLLRIVERRLMKLLNMIRGKGVVTKREPPSTFLKHVAEHKNGIRKR